MEIVESTMKIVQYPHPSLRHPAQPLKAIDRKLILMAERMVALMYENKGLGLAGPQVGMPFQIFVANYVGDPERRDQEGIFINPVVLERRGSQEGEEGCLSFPGLYQKVRRAKTVKVQAYNLKGESIECELHDLQARIWQHEVDHLHGILYIDKMGPLGKLSSRGSLREFERDYRKAQQRGEIPSDDAIQARLRKLAQEGPDLLM
jgi:peptide deformylase